MKRYITWVLILVMLFGMTSCKKAGEEKATNGEFIEGAGQQTSGDSPDKVTDWVVIDPSGATQTPSNPKPNDQKDENEEIDPSEQPDEEQNEESKEPEQKPVEQPDEEQKNDPPVTDQEQKPVEQPDNTPSPDEDEEDFEEEPVEDEEPEADEEEPEPDEEDSPSAPVNPSVKPVDPKANVLKIVSYNVRCKDDGSGKKISERAPRLKKQMDQYDPDIMGMQEVVPAWLTYLEDYFSDEYEYINRWRAASNKESTPIFWKKDKFTLVESGHFWLSDTPEKEGKAESWGAKNYRICMWVKLQVKATGKIFLFYNTHFDTKDGPKVPSAELVIERTTKKGGFNYYAVFCTGDYNMEPDSDGYKAMYARFHDINRDLNNDKSPTYTSYGSVKGKIIDFCFYSPGKVQPIKYTVLEDKVDGGYVSDHNGLYIEAKLL